MFEVSERVRARVRVRVRVRMRVRVLSHYTKLGLLEDLSRKASTIRPLPCRLMVASYLGFVVRVNTAPTHKVSG